MIYIDEKYIPLLDEMLIELSTECLEVCLIPSQIESCANDGGMIRTAYNRNPQWYRELCRQYPCTRTKRRTERKDYTRIKRQDTIKIIERMIKNKKSNSIYAEDLLQVAIDRFELWEDAQNPIPWNNQF